MTIIRTLREERHVSQRDLARSANLHRSVLSKLETGADKAGQCVRLRLSTALGVEPAALFDVDGWPLLAEEVANV